MRQSRHKSKSTPKKTHKQQSVQKQQPQAINYEFINKDISVHLKCPQCKQLMQNPLRLHPCAHTYCQKCSPTSGKCPKCNTNIRTVQKDLIGEGLVNELMVRCLNQGCPYKETFQDYKKYHQGNCKLKIGLDQWLKGMKNTLQEHERKGKIFDTPQADYSPSQAATEKKDQSENLQVFNRKSEQRSQNMSWFEQMTGKYLKKLQ